MSKYNKSNIMKHAWELYRLYRCKRRSQFAAMLRDAWQQARWKLQGVAQVSVPSNDDIQELMIVTKERLTDSDFKSLKTIRNAA